jgi:hypothetical protein
LALFDEIWLLIRHEFLSFISVPSFRRARRIQVLPLIEAIIAHTCMIVISQVDLLRGHNLFRIFISIRDYSELITVLLVRSGEGAGAGVGFVGEELFFVQLRGGVGEISGVVGQTDCHVRGGRGVLCLEA